METQADVQPTITGLETLPNLCTENILYRLPIKSLIRCTSLNRSLKTYRITPDNQRFAFKQFSRAARNTDPDLFVSYEGELYCSNILDSGEYQQFKKMNPPFQLLDFTIIGSCNGYLCLSTPWSVNGGSMSHLTTYNVNPWRLYNPFTKHFLELPPLGEKGMWASGFGFHPDTKEYKVVMIPVYEFTVYHVPNQSSCLQILTVGSNQWTEKPFPSYLHELTHIDPNGVCVNGSLYWLTKENQYRNTISSFDLDTDTFEKTELPESIDTATQCECRHLFVFRGCLAVMVHDEGDDQMEIWVMKSYGIKKSWNKDFVIKNFKERVTQHLEDKWMGRHQIINRTATGTSYTNTLTLLSLLIKDDMILIKFTLESDVVYYDFKRQSFIDFQVQGIQGIGSLSCNYMIFAHTGSLIHIGTPHIDPEK